MLFVAFITAFVLGNMVGEIYIRGLKSPEAPTHLTIASQVAGEHDYSPAYKCAGFSNDLVEALQAEGYFAMEQSVTVKDYNGLHSIAVLILPIEATDGTILTPDKWKARGYEWFGEATDCQRCMKKGQPIVVKQECICPDGFEVRTNAVTGEKHCEKWIDAGDGCNYDVNCFGGMVCRTLMACVEIFEEPCAKEAEK